jgi:hypothetical protein
VASGGVEGDGGIHALNTFKLLSAFVSRLIMCCCRRGGRRWWRRLKTWSRSVLSVTVPVTHAVSFPQHMLRALQSR